MEPSTRRDEDAIGMVAACLDGDERAWRWLVDKYSPLVWTVARSHRLSPADCQDVYQFTWLRTVQHLSKLRSPAQVGQWLTTTARRESLKCIERNRRHVPVGDSAILEEAASHAETPDELVLRFVHNSGVRLAFAQLPQRDRTLLGTLMVEPTPSYDEVSRALGLPRGSIGPLRQRALTRLRALLPNAAAV